MCDLRVITQPRGAGMSFLATRNSTDCTGFYLRSETFVEDLKFFSLHLLAVCEHPPGLGLCDGQTLPSRWPLLASGLASETGRTIRCQLSGAGAGRGEIQGAVGAQRKVPHLGLGEEAREGLLEEVLSKLIPQGWIRGESLPRRHSPPKSLIQDCHGYPFHWLSTD